MTEAEIVAALDAAEVAVSGGDSLDGTGFWKAVAAIKSSPELAPRFADRVAAIDNDAFRAWALLVLPFGVGTVLALAVTAIGIAAVVLGFVLDEPADWIAFLIGSGILIVATHSLGHLVAGRLMGIRFNHWFVGTVRRPQPGLKVDYSSYLRTPARRRAWMHAAGALLTKVVAIGLVVIALTAGLPAWVVWSLAAVAAGAILTDIVWSTRSSDWKRFRREMSYT